MRVLGMMSGTSLDGIDVVLADLDRDPSEPSTLRARLLHVGEEPWPEATRRALRAVLPPAPADVATWNRLHAQVGEAFGAAAARVLARHGGADLIAAHGQTLHHDVRADGTVAGTLQIGDASRIAAAAGVPVLSDLRAADVAAGGQGAPLVPILDQLLLGGDAGEVTAVLNIGGISNVTRVGAAPLLAGDLGPGNALLDAAVHAATGRSADHDAALARTGTVDAAALEALLAEPFYARPLPRSTGREHFDAEYVRRMLGERALAALALPDLLATLVELTAVTIAEGIASLGATRVVASGGGIRNPLLRERLAAHLAPLPLRDADELGIPADGKEALLMALLGHLGAHGLPGTLALADGTAHTGARRPVVLGALTPPHALRDLPRTAADGTPVTRLVLHPAS
ncbi:anhydro-N-acetylmuramic acid kinase [Brachybacterium saurashtrense]|uniref:Anhydro-N-acetylmuramic acid kinase n=1 Tax=Brachybacterium saurashtrense TaxID=556288 RepID=A0A345YPZ1_9MICO|nr:anhydro-N-acetylmuramic acid kinase [Brachybacterium saurashtrense]AXK45993.1 anhydro-N-acetylmuramic acid kinase [Brachybacterium saurashtrense]RRR23732.1 anhydro-N-acetylmuramic acid kinase [Brachybacterium saurashtrense]